MPSSICQSALSSRTPHFKDALAHAHAHAHDLRAHPNAHANADSEVYAESCVDIRSCTLHLPPIPMPKPSFFHAYSHAYVLVRGLEEVLNLPRPCPCLGLGLGAKLGRDPPPPTPMPMPMPRRKAWKRPLSHAYAHARRYGAHTPMPTPMRCLCTCQSPRPRPSICRYAQPRPPLQSTEWRLVHKEWGVPSWHRRSAQE